LVNPGRLFLEPTWGGIVGGCRYRSTPEFHRIDVDGDGAIGASRGAGPSSAASVEDVVTAPEALHIERLQNALFSALAHAGYTFRR
jgi:hypothetical protein